MSADVLARYMHGGNYGTRRLAKRAVRASGKGRTPGREKRPDTCRLTPIAGMPRKFFMRARARNHPSFAEWAEHCRRVNI